MSHWQNSASTYWRRCRCRCLKEVTQNLRSLSTEVLLSFCMVMSPNTEHVQCCWQHPVLLSSSSYDFNSFFNLLWSGFTVICWARDAVNYLVWRFIAFVANTNQVHSPFHSGVAVCTVSTDMAGNLLFLVYVSQSTVFVLSADWICQLILS